MVAELTDGAPPRPRRMRALCALWRDRRRRRRGDRGDGPARSRAGSTAAPCSRRCRRAPPATRSIARSGTSRPSAPARPVHELAGPAGAEAAHHRLHDLARRRPTPWRQQPRRPPSRALLKVKLGGADDPARIAAVRRAAPDAELIVDANEGWTPTNLADNLAACAQAGVTLIEQPLPADRDDVLRAHQRGRCRSAPTRACMRAPRSPALVGKYDAVNIKLDKTGGLTEALAMAQEAERLGFALMVGCMVATSLAMAPAMLVAQRARVVDLDGALLLARDRPGRRCATKAAACTRRRRRCGADARLRPPDSPCGQSPMHRLRHGAAR